MKILIAIPHSGVIHVALANYLLAETKNSTNTVSVIFEGRDDLCRARNALVVEFLNGDWDKMLMIDSDTVPPLGAADLMAGLKHKMVSGLYFRFGNDQKGEQAIIPVLNKYTELDETGGYCARAGLGCMMVDREVLLKMQEDSRYMPWFEHIYAPKGDEFLASEDLNFCDKAKQLGYELFAAKKVVCDHWKTISPLKFFRMEAQKPDVKTSN